MSVLKIIIIKLLASSVFYIIMRLQPVKGLILCFAVVFSLNAYPAEKKAESNTGEERQTSIEEWLPGVEYFSPELLAAWKRQKKKKATLTILLPATWTQKDRFYLQTDCFLKKAPTCSSMLIIPSTGIPGVKRL